MRLAGAGLIAAACLLACAIYAAEERQRLRELRELAGVLRLMGGEMETRLTPLPELTSILQKKTKGSAKSFLEHLENEMGELGEKDFGEIWEEAAQASFRQLDGEDRESLTKLGNVLGRYSIDIQMEALRDCTDKLEEKVRKNSEAAPARKRVGMGMICAFCALLLIVLM